MIKLKFKAKIRNNSATVNKVINKKQQGFTLIELLVVVSILAALAGLTSVAMDGYQQDAEAQITRVEMQRIANAIRRFRADTGYWPKTDGLTYAGEDAASFSFLFNNPNDEIRPWEPEYAIGWHGPYIDLPAMKTVIRDPANSPTAGCSGLANNVVTAAASSLTINALVDRFQQIREINTGKNYCVLTRDQDNMAEFKVAEFSASPYLYEANYSNAGNALCSGSDGCVVLRSFGADGIDNDGIDASDDIVFVLAVN